MNETTRRLLVPFLSAGLIVIGGSADAAPAGPTSYAVVVLIGDALSIVTYRPAVGTSLDNNARQRIPIEDDHFDDLAVRTAGAAIRRAVPGATTRLLLMGDKAAAASDDELTSPPRLKTLLEPMSAQLRQGDTHWLVVVSKHRADAHMRMANGTIGNGKLSGLGFYLDERMRMTNRNTGKSGAGFVAPFAYLTVSLIDVDGGTVVRSESATESTVFGTAGSDTAVNPWEALTPEEKVRILDRLIERVVGDVVPRVVAPA